jgi:hypothetical protein
MMKNSKLETVNWIDDIEAFPKQTITKPIRGGHDFIDMDTDDPMLTGHLKRYEVEQLLLADNGGFFQDFNFEIIFNKTNYVVGKVNGHYFIGLKTMLETTLMCDFPDGWRALNKTDFDETLRVVYERCSDTLILESLERCIKLMNGKHVDDYMRGGWISELDPNAHDELIELIWNAHQHLQTENNKNKEI